MRSGDLVFKGQQFHLTKFIDAGAVAGDALTHTGEARVGRGADGAPFVAKCEKVERDGVATVAEGGAGYIDIATVGTLPLGFQTLVVDGAGKVKVGAGGTRCFVNIARDGIANIKI
ncbi:hypothetical protein D3875_02750 [Deinococcus cavernae]|uniref:DUF2190 family protein n=1 Tax=Deinococcus cavernae TaxID=2320857 RepID=A0A418VFV7_9DEIO|nr:hypothetical protein [Deinococcus cavernae]RJF74931.1 hypothetical protein D3875_02750 [Deinococcus cavernae]